MDGGLTQLGLLRAKERDNVRISSALVSGAFVTVDPESANLLPLICMVTSGSLLEIPVIPCSKKRGISLGGMECTGESIKGEMKVLQRHGIFSV